MGLLHPRVVGAAAATVDRAVATLLHKRRPDGHEQLGHEARLDLLWSIHDEYGSPELYASPDAYFTPPEPIEPRLFHVRDLPEGGRAADASWQSRYDVYLPSMRAAWAEHPRNTTCHARLLLHPEPRPTVLVIHGYMAGHFRLEEMVWPGSWLYRRGLDVAYVQLPFHGLRAIAVDGGPRYPFPGSDPRMTNEGFRQAMHDLRAVARWLRRRGSPAVGAIGMSLGGYTTSLLATVEADLAFAAPIIPLASLADFARDQGRLGSRREQPAQHRALEAASFVVSPLARPSLVPSDRVLVIAADADRITPPTHAARLAHHFAADLVRIPGGHLVQVGMRAGWRAIGAMLERAGLLAPRPPAGRAGARAGDTRARAAA